MRTSNITRLFLLTLVFASVSLPGCGEEETLVPPELNVEDPDAFVIDGTVEFVPVEGGCWSILADEGTRYEPLGMPSEFYTHALRVRAAVKYRRDLLSICMIGTVVEVLEIKRYTSR